MSFLNKNLFFTFFFTSTSIIISSYLWDKINLEFQNPHEIVGNYSDNKHNVNNDTLRYLLFIFLPLITFFLSFLYFKNENIFKKFDIEIFKINNIEKSNNTSNKNLIFIIILILFSFILKDWSIYSLDIFEDGISLSGSILFENNKIPWKEVYINTGLFYDMLNAKISWEILGFKTIGSFKFYKYLLNLFCFLLIIILIKQICNQFYIVKLRSNAFFFISIITYIILREENIWRDIPIFLFLISVLKYLNTKNTFSLITICFLTIFTFFWSLDRGFFILLSFLPFLMIVLLNSKKEFFKFLFVILIINIIIILFTDLSIIKVFLNHTKEILSQHEMLNGVIHPKPFSDEPNSTRATKALLFIILNIIFATLILFYKFDIFENNSKFIFLIFSISNLLIYKSALSRSDGPHIKEATFYSIILLTIIIIIYFFYLLDKNKLYDKLKKKFIYLKIFLFFSLLFQNFSLVQNFSIFPKNISNYISKKDEFFINNKYNESLDQIKQIFKEKSCVTAYSYDQAIFYLLKKPSCSMFYNVWVIGSKKNQIKYINEIKDGKYEYILTGGSINFRPLGDRYPYIDDFIKKNYSTYKEINSWRILQINN